MFKLPEITYPLSIDTIGKMMAMGDELSFHCLHRDCRNYGRVNLVLFARKYGIDHSCLAADLAPLFHCPKCRREGRPDRNIGFINSPMTAPHSDWPRDAG
jgi:hypothetical protein